MEYFNLITKEVKDMTEMEFELVNHNGQWIEHDIILNKIVIVSISNFKIFPKDELGLNKEKILPLLEYFKPASKESAIKIAKYYKVCPYCSKELDNNNLLILDCKESFLNVSKMQFDAYSEISCCGNTYLVPFRKTLGTKHKAEFLKEQLLAGSTALCSFKIDAMYLEVLVPLRDLAKYLKIDKITDYKIMKSIFDNKEYLAIKNNDVLEHEEVIIDNLEQQILYYLSRR